jgi:catechol 2,3-dioxygenase-like lactoylglutathione lyase family enzyme
MDHVGIVVDDLPTATEFFVVLGLELRGEATLGGRSVDRIVGLDGVGQRSRSCEPRTATDSSS